MPIAQPASWVIVRLDSETADRHAEAEADLFRILDDPTRANYHRFLARVFQLEYAVEAQLVRLPDLPVHFVVPRLKTGRLGDDLLALGRESFVDAVFAHALELPRFRDAIDALAWIYVLQRNTLHHQRLYRALAPHLRDALPIASRYLTTHASDVYVRWHELGIYLDQVVAGPQVVARMVEAARHAFVFQHQWYVARG